LGTRASVLLVSTVLAGAQAWAQGLADAPVSPPREALEGCLRPGLCYRVGDLAPGLQQNRVALYVVAAVLPLGGAWGPLLLLEPWQRPPFQGDLARHTVAHGVVPAAWALLSPWLGLGLGLVVGGISSGVMGAVTYGVLAGVVGAIVLWIGGGPVMFVLGSVVGAVYGLVVGGLLLGVAGLLLGGAAGAVPALAWQLYLSPVNALRAWDRAARAHGATAPDLWEPGQRRRPRPAPRVLVDDEN
jgi:hypothetical protein